MSSVELVAEGNKGPMATLPDVTGFTMTLVCLYLYIDTPISVFHVLRTYCDVRVTSTALTSCMLAFFTQAKECCWSHGTPHCASTHNDACHTVPCNTPAFNSIAFP